MNKKRKVNETSRFEKALSGKAKEHYLLRLYIAGTSPRSMRALSNLKEVCEAALRGRYQLEVIDLYQQPALAEVDQILATPTLVKRRPPPPRRFIGDMSDKLKILAGLDLQQITANATT